MSDHNEEHLGDGVYVSFDGWHFCLRAPRPRQGIDLNDMIDHVVYLEKGYGGTLTKFLAYVRLQLAQAEFDQVQAEQDDERKQAAAQGFPDG